MKWKWRNDRRSERNLCNCVKKPEKNSGLQRGLNPWPRDTGAMLYQLSYEVTDVCSQRQWLHSSVGKVSHRYREVTGSNPVEVPNFFQASLRNCMNCVHCVDHFFIFVEVIVDRKVLFHGWLIYSYLHIFKLIKCKWLPGECADWFFNNIMTWSYCLHRRYSMFRQKNSILINEHALNREPVPLKGPQLRK